VPAFAFNGSITRLRYDLHFTPSKLGYLVR
jgi:hypothetical protein